MSCSIGSILLCFSSVFRFSNWMEGKCRKWRKMHYILNPTYVEICIQAVTSCDFILCMIWCSKRLWSYWNVLCNTRTRMCLHNSKIISYPKWYQTDEPEKLFSRVLFPSNWFPQGTLRVVFILRMQSKLLGWIFTVSR